MSEAAYWCERAWLPPGRVAPRVRVRLRGTRIAAVDESGPGPGDVRLAGLTLPGLANAHSHAFHRALRSRTHTGRGTFWTWRDRMYAVAERLDPDTYHELAVAVFAEMALAGVTCVGEFHYLHHGPGGTPYQDPNAMGEALVAAARTAGLRLSLLDACYLTRDIGRALEGAQLRFGDGDAERWAQRVDELRAVHADHDDVVVGAAVHSVRAVPADQMPALVAWADGSAAPIHVHVSEQPAENEACQAAYGRTPTEVLADTGLLGPRATAVHATHVTAADIDLVGRAAAHVCLCPTTERDLGDGIGPARRLHDAGARITLGSDSHAVIDLLEEGRALELHERLATHQRGHWSAAQVLDALTVTGHTSLGFPDAGTLAPGGWADLVTVRLDSVRTAGADDAAAEAVVFAATAADVSHVVAAGRQVVVDGRHILGDVGALLTTAIGKVCP